jgi:hypothetical protein
MLGLGAAAAVAPQKTYAFFGGILRPRRLLELGVRDPVLASNPAVQAWLEYTRSQMEAMLVFEKASHERFLAAYDSLYFSDKIVADPPSIACGHELLIRPAQIT